MWTVHKFPVPAVRSFELSLPNGFRPMSLQEQDGTVCLWVMLDDAAERRPQRFEVRGTGHDCSGLERWAHVGTIVIATPDKSYVFHVFCVGD